MRQTRYQIKDENTLELMQTKSGLIVCSLAEENWVTSLLEKNQEKRRSQEAPPRNASIFRTLALFGHLSMAEDNCSKGASVRNFDRFLNQICSVPVGPSNFGFSLFDRKQYGTDF